MQEQVPRVVIGMDPHKRSVTIEVMTADETIVGGCRFDTTVEGYAAMVEQVAAWPERVWAIDRPKPTRRFTDLATRPQQRSHGCGARPVETVRLSQHVELRPSSTDGCRTLTFQPSCRLPPGREPPGQLRADADTGAEGDCADDDGDEPVPLLLRGRRRRRRDVVVRWCENRVRSGGCGHRGPPSFRA